MPPSHVTWLYHVVVYMAAIAGLQAGKIYNQATNDNSNSSGRVWEPSNEKCLMKCSDQVNCTIWRDHQCARQDNKKSRDIASQIDDLESKMEEDGDDNIYRLTWSPPRDGSFRTIKEFRIWAAFISDGVHTHCFHIKPDEGWKEIYARNEEVKFYLDCLRVKNTWKGDIEVHLNTEPSNPNVPQRTIRTIDVEPTFVQPKWSTKLMTRLTPDHRLVMHMASLAEDAEFYDVEILQKNGSSRLPRKSFVFAMNVTEATSQGQGQDEGQRQVPKSVAQKDESEEAHIPIIVNKEGGATFIVPGVDWLKTRLYFYALDKNLNMLHHPVLDSDWFIPNRTSSVALVPTESPDNRRTIIIVCVVVLLFLVVISVVLFRVCRGDGAGKLSCTDLIGWSNNSTGGMPRALVIYNRDNDYFFQAVESHVMFLRHYADVISVHSHAPSLRLLPFFPNLGWVTRELKHRTVLIYMSPGMRDLMALDDLNINNARKCIPHLDEVCLYTLQCVQRTVLRGSNTPIRLVTFDCFDLSSSPTSPSDARGDAREYTFPGTTLKLSAPLNIAKPDVTGAWRLTGIDQLLRELRHDGNPFATNGNLPILDNWCVHKEVKDTERLISLCGKSFASSSRSEIEVTNENEVSAPLRQHVSHDNMDPEDGSVHIDFVSVSDDENSPGVPLSYSEDCELGVELGTYESAVRWHRSPGHVFPPCINNINSTSTDSFYSDLNKFNINSGWAEPPYQRATINANVYSHLPC